MTRVRRLSAAMLMAGMVAGFMVVGSARVEAAKPGGGGGQDAVCAYLLKVINYPYVSPTIKAWASSLYTSLGCTPAL